MANNISELYNQVINEHRKYPRNKGLIEGYKTLHLKNPSCGDDVTVQVNIKEGKVVDVRHDGTGCVICCSSASVMSEVLIGKTVKEASEIIDDFYELIKGNIPADEERLEDAIDQVLYYVRSEDVEKDCLIKNYELKKIINQVLLKNKDSK